MTLGIGGDDCCLDAVVGGSWGSEPGDDPGTGERLAAVVDEEGEAAVWPTGSSQVVPCVEPGSLLR